MICGGRAWTAAVAATVLLAGCGGSGPAAPRQTPHGYVRGAEETAEPQRRLILAEAAGGTVHALDPATGRTAAVGTVQGLQSVGGDGRFAYLATGGGVHVLDTGVWTVDHGDHVHYYRARTRMLGHVPDTGTVGITGDAALTALPARGGVRVLDRESLDGTGRIAEPVKVAGRVAVPYAGRLLVAGEGRVAVHDRTGRRVSRFAEPCPDPRGQATTRRGAVIGCADGALLVTGNRAHKIAYPGAVPADERATEFRHRPGSPVLAARAGDKGAWVLDLAARKWNRVGSGPTLAVNAVGEDAPVLLLGRDGTMRSHDPATGRQKASKRILDGAGPGAVIEVDAARAYVNDAAGKAVHEIDYNDDLRLARTFDLPFAPGHMVETGW
ncbi:lipoprotein [Actinomadura vinacea]|uniref:Lipoprotein n=1 Tax=Actinomadura vinacea TaxID=115336 RepID=A0ABP5WTM2_9ACTN